MNELDKFLDLFINALNCVGQPYFETVYNNVREIKNGFSIYYQRRIRDDNFYHSNERVFCYELYHQLRLKIEEARNGKEDFLKGTMLQGEVYKMQIVELLERFHLRKLSDNFIPDFIMHSPGSAESHPYVIEVKADSNLRYQALFDDIDKIVQFITQYDYQRGIFLSVTTDFDYLVKVIKDCELLKKIEDLKKCSDQIFIINKQSSQHETQIEKLSEILSNV